MDFLRSVSRLAVSIFSLSDIVDPNFTASAGTLPDFNVVGLVAPVGSTSATDLMAVMARLT